MNESELIEVVYDDECPVCHHYCARLEANESVNLKLTDARKPGETMDIINARGLDIDEGMVMRKGNEIFYGSEAIHEISKYTHSHNSTGLMNRFIFRYRTLAVIVYPLMKEVRNLILRMKGIKKINNLNR